MQELNNLSDLDSRHVLRMRVDATSYEDATQRIMAWAEAKQGVYVCAANVHMTMEVWDSRHFSSVVNEAALIAPDGMPLVWALHALGIRSASRVYGPTLTLHVCEAAARLGVPLALYGGTQDSLKQFSDFLRREYPGLNVVCEISPPFRSLTSDEDAAYTHAIIESGARLLLVGIGCPKQEKWMAEHCNRIPAVMLGVGAAFDFHSGRIRQAPHWMQHLGLEWLFRLAMEPRRLWKRYFYNNPRFLLFFLKQYLTF